MATGGKKTIALDFDGVLHRYAGWKGGKMNGPIAGALDAVEDLEERGFAVVIYSARPAEQIRPWLEEHGFPPLKVVREKPVAAAYVDDLAVRFEGKWTADLIERIAGNEPYWKRKEPNTLGSIGQER